MTDYNQKQYVCFSKNNERVEVLAYSRAHAQQEAAKIFGTKINRSHELTVMLAIDEEIRHGND